MQSGILKKTDCLILFFSVVIILPSLAKGQSTHQLGDSIDALLSPWKNDQRPGLSVAVIKDGNVLYNASVGMGNIKTKMSNDSSTTFWIASVTKQFTAAAVYKLVVEKKIALNKSIRSYLTDLPSIFQKVTIDQLIHHTSGIRDGFVLTALAKNPPSAYTNDNVVHYLKQTTDLNFPSGTKFEYNNSGYVLLALLIEKVSGKSYPAYMKENIFQPLAMNQTYVSPGFPTKSNQAEGYKEAGNSFQEYHFEGNTYGSTGIVTTLADLSRWSMFLQNPGSVPALTQIAKPLLATGKLTNGKVISYAGGLERFKYHGRTMYEHFGSDEGFKADMIYFPESKVSVIGMTNNDNYYELLALLCKISDWVHDERRSHNDMINESEQKVSESSYYNSAIPRFVRVQHFSTYSKVGSTPAGYAAPYKIVGDTLRSLDPVPTQYLKKTQFIEAVDFYYQNGTKLAKIQPVARKDDLAIFAGEYNSGELQTSYKIIGDENGLQFEFVPGVTFDLYRLSDTDFMFEYLGPNFLQFSKNTLHFSREGCRRLKLEKNSQ